ncbi:MAG: hypothetical protein LQ347_002314 [Umbilicaria vellea]|nr:MAG: hypothetical protein LQ347_002314 [Umbilicaria vellea]
MENDRAIEYLRSLLGKQLHVCTTDTRMFVGEFKCTDNERNVILSRTYEYRQPSTSALEDAATNQSVAVPRSSIKVDMTSRFLGLVVIPGHEITSIEVEEAV